MSKSKVISLFLAAAMSASLLGGCTTPAPAASVGSTPASTPASTATSDTPSSTATPEKKGHDEFVKLKFFSSGTPVKDQERIMTKANKIIKDSINAELELNLSDNYAEKINMMIGAGEEFDICFMGAWGNMNYWENANDGAFLDLTDMIPMYAPQSYARIPEGLWEGVKVDGRIHAIVNYQQWGVAARKGFSVRLDLADEFGFDWKALKGKDSVTVLKALDPFIAQVKAKYPEMIGWETTSNYSFFAGDPLYWDMEPIGDSYFPGWVYFNDPTKVVNQYASPEFKAYCDIMRDYYNKGYVRSDGATLKDALPDRQAAKLIAAPAYGWPDQIDNPPTGVKELTMKGFTDAGYQIADMSQVNVVGKAPKVDFSTTRTVIPAAAASTACTAISVTSKNPERALELIELLNTNDELFNLISYGEEGVDWHLLEADKEVDGKVIPKGTFEKIPGMYDFNWNEWTLGQSYSPDFARSKQLGTDQKSIDQKKSMEIVFQGDKTAEASPTSGFNFDTEPVKTEIANCSAVVTEMLYALSNGSVDPATKLPEFLKRLDEAGVNTIISEKQKQLDAFNAAKK